MPDAFHQFPILNSPYRVPARHWVLDKERQPTDTVGKGRREVSFISPIPKARKGGGKQVQLALDAEGGALDTDQQQYQLIALIDSLRRELAKWRALPEAQWRVTPETARLLKHWRHHQFTGFRPFFCQVEAVETVIWLTEVAPGLGKAGSRFLEQIEDASQQANPGLSRMALKLATGAGKTAVMAMLIAWQTVNAVRRPNSRRFTRGFLVVAPGITIRDRLRVLLPNDPDSYYASRELVPADMLRDLDKAKIVITNYHALQLRETLDLAKGSRALLQGRGPALASRETEGQMLARVMPELMTMKGVLVLNDEAHHCYREKPGEHDEGKLVGDDLKEAKLNEAAARVWISGIEAVQRQLGRARVIDLSATPFFLRGSGYREGTLFPWTVSDFSLMDAIECGIVKLPRVPVVDNVPGEQMPIYRNLWEHIGKKMPKKRGGVLDPLALPRELQTALEALYGHYEKTHRLWEEAGIDVPPCFIVVCNNTATSKLVYDYIAGFERQADNGERTFHNGRLELFRNFDSAGEPLPKPRTLLIDSRQLESGEGLDKNFRTAASDEIERFRREIIERTGDRQQAEKLTDQDLLREVMNTVGKAGRLGGGIRCVVSVAMLTEGWDANTVTHVLGLRAFGTQLLCEQVIGRSLRRQSYALNEQGLFDAEYADVFGIPFDFTAKPVIAPPQKPAETVQVKALSPERDQAEIRFPRVAGYRVELPDDQLTAEFTEDSKLVLTPELVGPTITHNQGIIGQGHDLTVEHLDRVRPRALLYHLTRQLLYNHWRDPNGDPELHRFGQLKRIAGRWLKECLVCKGDTRPAQLMIADLANMACERISDAITRAELDRQPVKAFFCEGQAPRAPLLKALLDPYNPTGTTRHVNFTTCRTQRYAASDRCHLNWAILDSGWEAEFCRVLDSHPKVLAWVKNQNLGFEVPYCLAGVARKYVPDFIALVDDGMGADDPLRLVVEVKGYRAEDAQAKAATMETYWVPGVNALGSYGRWGFLELRDPFDMEVEFDRVVRSGGRAFTAPVKRDEALELLRSHKQALAERFGIEELALFGSVARDQATVCSDVDVLVRFAETPGLRELNGAQSYLEDVFGRRIDLVTDKGLRQEMRPYVEREAVHV